MAMTVGVTLSGCKPGYMKASELEHRDQGPAACSKSCQDLGMRMVAMVLVSDMLPGCVCQVLEVQAPLSAPPAGATPGSVPPANGAPAGAAHEGAAASVTGYVVIAAAAAARQQQAQQEQYLWEERQHQAQ
jgi:hypothetical protein